MISKLSLSLAAALALSAAGGVARADPNPTRSDESRPRSPTNDEIDAAETGVPASIDYANRVRDGNSPTNDQINAVETGNPDSPDYRNRVISSDGNWKSEWEALEADSPHNPQPGKHAVLEGDSAYGPSAQ